MICIGGKSALPAEIDNPFGPCWGTLIDDVDRINQAIQSGYAALVTLQRSLKNGAAHINQSNAFRNPDELFIPHKTWETQRSQHYRSLQLPRSARTCLKPIRAALKSGLAQLDAAIAEDVVRVEDDRVRLCAPTKAVPPAGLMALRRQLITGIGQTQLPEVLLDVDSTTQFSWLLLGRPPRHERELITVYAALLALGSDLTAADIVRMIPVLSAEMVEPVIAKLEHDQVLRNANDAVVRFMRSNNITKYWDPGISVSADMMSLEATRHLWLSRLDPRRRSFAVGTYTHVLDQWGIVYDQPIVLNKRQAGALTLLTNIVMAFNTKQLQDQIDADPALDQPELLAHIAPHAVGHINLRGTFTFGLDRYHAQLFQAPIRRRVLNYRAENPES